MRQTLLLLLCGAAAVHGGWNAAAIWNLENNATYFPTAQNVLFGTSLAAMDTAFRQTGAQVHVPTRSAPPAAPRSLYLRVREPRTPRTTSPPTRPPTARATPPPPQGLYALDWTEPRAEARARGGVCLSPIPRFRNSTRCVTIRRDIDAHWAAARAALEPWRRNGTVAGVFLGDELCYHGASLANLTYVTRLIRRDWPEAVLYINEAQDLLMCNFNRLNETFFGARECWPPELDWLGFDIYGFDRGAAFDAPRRAYDWNLFDRMSSDAQYAVQTTVGFGGHDAATEGWTLADYDDFCAANAALWFEFAAAEPRVGGVFPWYWRTGTYYPAPPSVPRINVTYGIGLDRLPRCRAAYAAWGRNVSEHTPAGRIRPHTTAPARRAPRAAGLCQPGVTETNPWRLNESWAFCDTHR